MSSAVLPERLEARNGIAHRGGRVVPVLALLAVAACLPQLVLWARQTPSGLRSGGFATATPLSVAFVFCAAFAVVQLWRGAFVPARAAAMLTIVGGVVGASIGLRAHEPSMSALGLSVTLGVMFVGYGAAVWTLAVPRITPRVLITAGSTGAAILALCAVLALTALADLLETSMARRLADVSLDVLIGMTLLSAALLRAVAAHEAVGVAPPRWMPVAVGAAGTLLMLVFWQTLLAREVAETNARAAIAADAVKRAMQRQLLVIDRALGRVALYAQSASTGFPLWRTSIMRLTDETVGLERIDWFDSTGALLRTTSDTALAPEVLAQLRTWARTETRRVHTSRGKVLRDSLVDARAIGAFGVVALKAVDATPNGPALLVGFVSEHALLNEFLPDNSSGFVIRAFVGDSQLAGPPRTAGVANYQRDMPLGDRIVTLALSSQPAPVRSSFPELLLVLGLAVSALASVTLWLARKRWEQASTEGMARMQRAIERSTDGVWELDLLQDQVHRSNALVRSLGYDPAQLNGPTSGWTRIMHVEDLPRVTEAMRAHLAGKSDVYECEYRIQAGDGSWHTIVDRGRLIERTVDGAPARVLGISADITERARSEAERERSERRFRVMFESAFQLELLLDLDGTILEANRAAAAVAGLSVDAMQGADFERLPWWIDDEVTAARVQERLARARGGDPTRFEVTITTADKRPGTIDFSLRPIRDANEVVTQLLVEGHDLSERKRAEESLRQIGALTTMGQLAARVAHEINNPLAGIQNAFLLVRGGIAADHPHFRFVGAIEREIARIAAVTRQLYETYRPDQSMHSNSSVVLAISDAVSFLEQVNRARNIRIVTSVAKAPSLVPVPDALLRQTLYNLVQNALDASPEHGTIEVSAVREGDECVIRVCDEGPGIPDAIRERIFEPFFSTKDRTVKTGGMGIGLSLVRQSVLAVGGEVVVRDRPTGGTEFEVRLPMVPIDTGVLR